MLRYGFLFFLFLFFRYQSDVIAYMLSNWVGHFVKPYPWSMALGLTLIWGVVGWLVERVLQTLTKHAKLWTLVAQGWAASACISMMFCSWSHQLILLVVAIALGALLQWLSQRDGIGKALRPSFYHTLTWAMLQLLLLCLYVGIGNGVSDLQHYELKTGQALHSKHPRKAYEVGEKSYVTSHRLFAMRCYLLAATHKKGLADKIFEQMVPKGGAECLLLPTDEMQNLLFPQDNLAKLLESDRHQGEKAIDYLHRCAWLAAFRDGKSHAAAIDYYLCGLLLDRQLDRFASELQRYYPLEVEKGSLPRYYAQALTLYKHLSTHPLVLYVDNSVEANYQDYSDMADTLSNPAYRVNLLRQSYGETYWWWYAYGAH